MSVTGQSIARAIRALRLHKGLSQRQVAARMNVPRSYCSKLECEKANPTLRTLERLARGLEVSIPELLSGGERSRQDEIRELLADPFIAELLPFLPRLTQVQKRGILLKVSQMTMRQRRTA
jgi:transcriptional regulator with XRE-family HTH domain